MCQPKIEPQVRKSGYFYVVMALSRGSPTRMRASYLCSCTDVGACRAARIPGHARRGPESISVTFEAQGIRDRCFASPRNDVRTILRPRRLACLKDRKVQP